MSSQEAPYSIANAASLIISPAPYTEHSTLLSYYSKQSKLAYGSNNMCSKKAISSFISKNLDHSIGIVVRLGAAVGGKREFANLKLHSLYFVLKKLIPENGYRTDVCFKGTNRRFQIFFGFADPSDFWMCVDDRWYAVVVDMNGSSRNSFYANDSFIFSFVSQHGAKNTVTNCVDTRKTASN